MIKTQIKLNLNIYIKKINKRGDDVKINLIIKYVIIILRILIIFLLLIEICKQKDKLKKINIIKNTNEKINNSNNSYIKKLKSIIDDLKSFNFSCRFKFLLPIHIIIISVIFSIIMYFVSLKVFSIKSSAIVISMFSFMFPYVLLKYIVYIQKENILKNFPTYISNLKKYVKTNNNIILAMKNAKASFPLSIYIENFNITVENGMEIYKAFDKLKKDINIERITEFITIIQVCYKNGGNFEKLLDRYSQILINRNLQKEKEKQNAYTSKIVLVILILINIYILYTFIYRNNEYFYIMTKTIPGIIIININILSYLFIIYLIKKINIMEE